MAGFGRTGKWFAVDNWDVVPDILTVAKGSIPATCRWARWSCAADRGLGAQQVLRRRPDLQRPSARVRVGVASIEAFQEEGIVEQSAATGDVFRPSSRSSPSGTRRSGGARPRLLLGPRAREEPRDARAARPVQRRGRGREADGRREKRALAGLYLMTHWNVVMCCPPLTITREELDEALAILDEALSVADEFVVALGLEPR